MGDNANNSNERLEDDFFDDFAKRAKFHGGHGGGSDSMHAQSVSLHVKTRWEEFLSAPAQNRALKLGPAFSRQEDKNNQAIWETSFTLVDIAYLKEQYWKHKAEVKRLYVHPRFSRGEPHCGFLLNYFVDYLVDAKVKELVFQAGWDRNNTHRLDPQLIFRLSRLSGLERFETDDYSFMSPSDGGAFEIFFRHQPNLRKLKIDCGFCGVKEPDTQSKVAILQGLRHLSSLESLVLSGLDITAEQFQHLMDSIIASRANHSLKIFKLSENEFGYCNNTEAPSLPLYTSMIEACTNMREISFMGTLKMFHESGQSLQHDSVVFQNFTRVLRTSSISKLELCGLELKHELMAHLLNEMKSSVFLSELKILDERGMFGNPNGTQLTQPAQYLIDDFPCLQTLELCNCGAPFSFLVSLIEKRPCIITSLTVHEEKCFPSTPAQVLHLKTVLERSRQLCKLDLVQSYRMDELDNDEKGVVSLVEAYTTRNSAIQQISSLGSSLTTGLWPHFLSRYFSSGKMGVESATYAFLKAAATQLPLRHAPKRAPPA